MDKKSIISVAKILVIPFLIALTACSPFVNASSSQEKIPTQGVLVATTISGNPSVTVKDQEYDGTTVIVADAFSQGPGWMVIHNQVDGVLGPPIGYTHIDNGDNKNIVVKIDPSQATPVMYAMLHTDAGDVGKYEFPGPDVPVMMNGEMLAPAFKAIMQSNTTNITPAVSVDDQDVSNGKVIIASVSSSVPGWIVVHTQGSDGNPGPEIGYTAVNPGISSNVVVYIDSSKATPVLFAMLHIDAGIIGKYEYPGPDEPQSVNGQMVSPSFKAIASTASMPTSMAGSSLYPTPANTPSVASTPTPDTGMAMVTPSGYGSPLVKVSDQPLVNGMVMVDEVVSAGPGWIVIYTTNANGQPDQPIGHAAVKDGDNLGVMVPVDPTMAQGSLYALLHVDAGTIGTFEYPGVDAPVMVGVQMIESTFKITTAQAAGGFPTPAILQPSITVSDQAVQNGTVTVAQVVSDGNWWLVIHRQNPDGSMGEYIGATLLKNGVNKNVVVTIDLKRATPVLYAMLHEDHGVIGQLEFPGPDVPVMVNGQMITPKFTRNRIDAGCYYQHSKSLQYGILPD